MRRVGAGASLSDFVTLAQSDPNFAGAWGEINGQLNLEGAGTTAVNSAKLAFTDAFEQISTRAFGVSGEDAINAAKSYVIAGQTVLGAVQMVASLVQNAGSLTPQAAAQAFTGTLIGLAVATGAVTAGLGAAITFGVGALLAVMSEAGLFNQPAQHCDFNVGRLCVTGPRVAPNSPNWRPFPVPNNGTDRYWFEDTIRQGAYPICYHPAGPGEPATTDHNITSMWRGALWGNCAYSAGQSHISINDAFPNFPQIAQDTTVANTVSATRGPTWSTEFQKAFYAGWCANAAYALNGLQPQADEDVLAHALRIWNRAHNGPSVPFHGMTYANSLVQLAINKLSSTDPLLGGGGLLINSGPIHAQPRQVVRLHLPKNVASATAPSGSSAAAAPMSTTTKVVAGTAAVGGAALIGTAVFAFATGKAIDAVFSSAWRGFKGWFK